MEWEIILSERNTMGKAGRRASLGLWGQRPWPSLSGIEEGPYGEKWGKYCSTNALVSPAYVWVCTGFPPIQPILSIILPIICLRPEWSSGIPWYAVTIQAGSLGCPTRKLSGVKQERKNLFPPLGNGSMNYSSTVYHCLGYRNSQSPFIGLA